MIFIDRSIPKSVAQALKSVRSDVIWLEDVFPHDTPDPTWLAEAGQKGWLVITRDKKIRTRPGERAAIAAAGVGCFVLTQKKDPTKWEYVKLLALTMDEMERIFDETPKPFIFEVNANGQFKRLSGGVPATEAPELP